MPKQRKAKFSERRHVEEPLFGSHRTFEAVVETTPSLIVLTDPDGHILLFNRACEELTGYKREEVIGKTMPELFLSPEWIPVVQKRFADPYAPEVCAPHENPWITKSGKARLIEWRCTVLPSLKDGRPFILGTGIDITERRQAEEAILKSQQMLKKTFASLRVAVFIIDAKTVKILDCNPATLEIFGYSREEMIGRTTTFLHVDESALDEFRKHLYPAIKEKGFLFLPEFRMKRKDGTVFKTEHNVMPLEDQQGNLVGWVSTVCDITERKRTEEALRKSEEEAKHLAQENTIMAEIGRIISSTLNIEEVYERFAEEVSKLIPFDMIMINLTDLKNNTSTTAYIAGIDVPGRRAGDITPLSGTGTEKVIRTRSSLLIQGDNIGEVAGRFPSLLPTFQAGLRSLIFVPLISKDQVIGVLSLRSTRPNAYTETDLRIAERVGNQIAGAIANAQLFTERKQAEEALLKSEERFKELYENAPVGYHEFDTEGRIARVNRTELEMLRYTAEEMLGRYIWDFIVEEVSREAVKAKLAGKLPPGRAFERTYQRKDGTTFPALIEDRLIKDAEGRITGIRTTIQDITERKRTEKEAIDLQEQLRQSQKIEAIGRLTGGIAHDFNNLLTVIKGYSQLSLLKLKEGDPLNENIEEIKRAADRASTLTQQLLAFSRRQILEFKVLDLNTILRDLDNMLHRIIGEDIELVYILSDDLGKTKSDPGQIEQVILNLAVNARDAMPSGGKLTIETANVVLNDAYARSHANIKSGRYVMLSVSDSGCGMSPEVKEHIFEPFFTTKEKGKGTGLGLSTVYGIVKQSGGDIWFYSEPGKGTTFKIYMPIAEETLEELEEKAMVKEFPLGSETILVVEDDLSVQDLAVRVLQRQGYTVMDASNGDEALRVIHEHAGENIHLLLTDVVMPRMDGKELAKQVKTLKPGIKVLFTSGYTDNVIVRHGLLEPGINFLQKPFSPEALAKKVREVLDK